MATTHITCCDCDETIPIEDSRKLKLKGLEQDLYICKECLKEVPLLLDQLEEIEKPEITIEQAVLNTAG